MLRHFKFYAHSCDSQDHDFTTLVFVTHFEPGTFFIHTHVMLTSGHCYHSHYQSLLSLVGGFYEWFMSLSIMHGMD